MKTSKKGYLRNSPDVNKPQNIIKGGDITMKGVDFNVHGIDSNGYAKVMTPGNNYKFPNAEYVIETPIKNNKKMSTFMSKHCSPISYGTPLEKKSCGSPNKQIDPETEKLVKKFRKNKTDWEESLKNRTPENRKTRDSLYTVYANTARKLKNAKNLPKDVEGQIMDGFDEDI